ncbi:MAG: YcaQ family DNA glycosylase [Chthonomonadales bacterium]|nr:YcaQ family DNA glycosylase [Chthonomonadales bacterium]
MTAEGITLAQARRLALRCQGLDGSWDLPPGKEGAAEVLQRLGYVQLDTIAVVERAHHHVLWSRRYDYEPSMLEQLQWPDRRVFEYWTFAASYLPIGDYRYYRPRMQSYAVSPRAREWREAHADMVAEVLARVRAEGPVTTSEFGAREVSAGSWWDRRPARQALDHLFSAGELMVARRRGFQRVFDLTERVLPADLDTTPPDESEMGRFLVRRHLAAHGATAAREVGRGLHCQTTIEAAIRELTLSGDVRAIEVEGIGPRWVLTRALADLDEPEPHGPPVHILSPFDNLVIDRQRLRRLFGFDYALECYLPEERRKFGFFVLPILFEGRFVGRMDVRADRPTLALLVRNLSMEPGVRIDAELVDALADRIAEFAAFNRCGQVRVERADPGDLAVALTRRLVDLP